MFIKRIPTGPIEANCYILCDEKTHEGAVMDIGAYSQVIEDGFREAGLLKLKYILCTHGHFDHIGGIAELLRHYPEAKVAIGEKDAPLLSDAERNLANVFGGSAEKAQADLLLKEGDELRFGEAVLRVLETPGHSEGGVSFVSDAERCVFTGDTLFRFTVGRTDLAGGCFSELLDSLEKLMKLPDDYTVYTGHNIPTDIGLERTTNMYLRKKK